MRWKARAVPAHRKRAMDCRRNSARRRPAEPRSCGLPARRVAEGATTRTVKAQPPHGLTRDYPFLGTDAALRLARSYGIDARRILGSARRAEISAACLDMGSASANSTGSSKKNGPSLERMCCGDARNSACIWTATQRGQSWHCSTATALGDEFRLHGAEILAADVLQAGSRRARCSTRKSWSTTELQRARHPAADDARRTQDGDAHLAGAVRRRAHQGRAGAAARRAHHRGGAARRMAARRVARAVYR